MKIKVIQPSVFPIVTPAQTTVLNIIEQCARTCYQSFDRQEEGSAERLLSHILAVGHHSVLEHVSITIRIITSRGVTHELVRHRLCAFSQESTRYVRYGEEVEIIKPYWLTGSTPTQRLQWRGAITEAISTYQELIKTGLSPQAARGVLPNDLKTDIVVTTNLREWRHILSLRLAKDAHTDMRIVMQMIAGYFMERLPLFFADLEVIKKRYHEEL